MSGKSPLVASAEQREGLRRLAVSANRAEADRARAILLSLSGWKSASSRLDPSGPGPSHSSQVSWIGPRACGGARGPWWHWRWW